MRYAMPLSHLTGAEPAKGPYPHPNLDSRFDFDAEELGPRVAGAFECERIYGPLDTFSFHPDLAPA